MYACNQILEKKHGKFKHLARKSRKKMSAVCKILQKMPETWIILKKYTSFFQSFFKTPFGILCYKEKSAQEKSSKLFFLQNLKYPRDFFDQFFLNLCLSYFCCRKNFCTEKISESDDFFRILDWI